MIGTTLYLARGYRRHDIGRKLNGSRKRTAHGLGMPVRASAAAVQSGPEEIQLIEAPYADALVHG